MRRSDSPSSRSGRASDTLICRFSVFVLPPLIALFTLNKAGGTHLDEGGICQLCQPPGDFCFAASSWANHENVLGDNLFLRIQQRLWAPGGAVQHQDEEY
ncbi:MAG: hypothetical protein FRX49_12063 [Trebouxia sp. A1-2]|nr:MAG: hypothetical protein FRX49_12063 [Trebouxia sp. A1-2]